MTGIEWTDQTWNVVTGCTKVSPGCRSCYMYRQYPRLKRMSVPGYEHSPDVVSLQPGRLQEPLRWRKPRRVFVNSMADTFHELVPDHFLRWMFQAMREAAARGHTFQVLTKRPERALEFWSKYRGDFADDGGRTSWPAGIWIGTSVEEQRYAGERLQPLLQIPAPVRFVSAEPLLGPLDLGSWLGDDGLQWVIVGGESGPRARPMEERWALELLEQCARAGVATFLKQLGGRRGKRGGGEAVLDGRMWREFPVAGAGRASGTSPGCAGTGSTATECPLPGK